MMISHALGHLSSQIPGPQSVPILIQIERRIRSESLSFRVELRCLSQIHIL